MKITTRNISKHYKLKKALDHVSVDFEPGKIHALLGENGAGKSTLAKILVGEILPTDGEIFLDNKKTSFANPRDALKKGIAIVHQRPLLAPSLTALENIYLSLGETEKSSFFIPKRVPEKISELKSEISPSLKLSTLTKDLGGNHRFYVSFITSLLRNPDCLILDEPSAFLDSEERDALYTFLKKLAKEGKNIIVITHSRVEAQKHADTITVLREGKLFYRSENGELPEEGILPRQQNKKTKTEDSKNEDILSGSCLSVKNLSCSPKTKPALLHADIQVDYGEITAISGMKEAAMETLEDLLCGLETEPAKGNAVFTRKNKTESIKMSQFTTSWLRKNGAAIVPSDKTFRASNPELRIIDMLSVYNKKILTENEAEKIIKAAGISASPDELCKSLSGGMLQRLILEREIFQNPVLVILCNPMHGLDSDGQRNLIQRIVQMKEDGKAVLIIGTADFPLSICKYVYALEGGKTNCTTQFFHGAEK